MVKVCVEVREGDGLFRVAVQAESISQAVSIVKGSHPDRDVGVVFPIDPGEFFAGASKATVGNGGSRPKTTHEREPKSVKEGDEKT